MTLKLVFTPKFKTKQTRDMRVDVTTVILTFCNSNKQHFMLDLTTLFLSVNDCRLITVRINVLFHSEN